MAMDILLYLGLFLAGASIYWFVFTVFAANEDSKALTWATGKEPKKSKSPIINFSRPLVHQFTLKYAQKITSEKFRKRVEYKIITGGLTAELNVDEFIGLKLLWGIMFPIVLFIMNFALQLGYPWPIFFFLAPVGYMIPDMHASAQKKKRSSEVIIDLPFFIELLALSTQAGSDFFGAIQKIIEKAEDSVLAEELNRVLQDTRIGSTREQAMKDMSYRLDVPEITSFVNVINDAGATGASVSGVLKDHAEQMRMERFVRAEKAGAKASQSMLIPMMLFILPAVFLIVLGPVILQFIYGGKT